LTTCAVTALDDLRVGGDQVVPAHAGSLGLPDMMTTSELAVSSQPLVLDLAVEAQEGGLGDVESLP
jgi:hypothetical protein